jgi:hypothetical protein
MFYVGTLNRLAHVIPVRKFSPHFCKYGECNVAIVPFILSESPGEMLKQWWSIKASSMYHEKNKSGDVRYDHFYQSIFMETATALH